MGFDVGAEAYDRFMGRYSVGLAAQMADLAGVRAGQRALDVGCGPGALTARARRPPRARPPSPPSTRRPRSWPRRGSATRASTCALAAAEELPFDDDEFDAALAQLVVHFMADPVAGLREMARVTRPGGAVAACVWDHAGGQGPLGVFWQAVHALDPDARDESDLAGAREGHLAELFAAARAPGDRADPARRRVEHPSFEEWWEPFTLGVGPAGAYVSALAAGDRDRLRELCRSLLPAPPFTVTARAWAVAGVSR